MIICLVYAEALSLMPLPQLWCVLFFLMMITIGFGSSLSLCECVLNSLGERFKSKINTKTKNTFFRFGICMIFFVIAFPMATRVWDHHFLFSFYFNIIRFYPTLIFIEWIVYSELDRYLSKWISVLCIRFLRSSWSM